jgi:hypothetical protein
LPRNRTQSDGFDANIGDNIDEIRGNSVKKVGNKRLKGKGRTGSDRDVKQNDQNVVENDEKNNPISTLEKTLISVNNDYFHPESVHNDITFDYDNNNDEDEDGDGDQGGDINDENDTNLYPPIFGSNINDSHYDDNDDDGDSGGIMNDRMIQRWVSERMLAAKHLCLDDLNHIDDANQQLSSNSSMSSASSTTDVDKHTALSTLFNSRNNMRVLKGCDGEGGDEIESEGDKSGDIGHVSPHGFETLNDLDNDQNDDQNDDQNNDQKIPQTLHLRHDDISPLPLPYILRLSGCQIELPKNLQNLPTFLSLDVLDWEVKQCALILENISQYNIGMGLETPQACIDRLTLLEHARDVLSDMLNKNEGKDLEKFEGKFVEEKNEEQNEEQNSVQIYLDKCCEQLLVEMHVLFESEKVLHWLESEIGHMNDVIQIVQNELNILDQNLANPIPSSQSSFNITFDTTFVNSFQNSTTPYNSNNSDNLSQNSVISGDQNFLYSQRLSYALKTTNNTINHYSMMSTTFVEMRSWCKMRKNVLQCEIDTILEDLSELKQ